MILKIVLFILGIITGFVVFSLVCSVKIKQLEEAAKEAEMLCLKTMLALEELEEAQYNHEQQEEG